MAFQGFFRPGPYASSMKIAASNTTLVIANSCPATSARPVPENPYMMDDVQLNGKIVEARQNLQELRCKEASGQKIAVAGGGAALAGFTALLTGQALASGHLSGAVLAPLATVAMGGIGVFCTGIWRRDTASINEFSARLDLESLERVKEFRAENKDGDPEVTPPAPQVDYERLFPAQEQLWSSERQLRGEQYNEQNGHLWGLFGQGIGLGSVVAGVGSILASGGHAPTGLLVTTAATGLAGAAVWAAGHSKEKKAAAAQPALAHLVAERQKVVDQLEAGVTAPSVPL